MSVTYDFLVLALLFLVPGAGVAWARPDLRPLMARMAVASLPFAVTERLFYPAYWRPRFVFDLADVLGFGIEDVMFVVGLSAFCSTAYAVVARRTLDLRGVASARGVGRAARMIGFAILFTLALVAARVPILYASVLAMGAASAAMLVSRRDLVAPACIGALTSGLVYLALCLVFAAIIPGVFETAWRRSVLLPGVFVLGVPADELLYGTASGFVATVFPAWVTERAFTPRGR